mgnify:CR=1 FL=1
MHALAILGPCCHLCYFLNSRVPKMIVVVISFIVVFVIEKRDCSQSCLKLSCLILMCHLCF